MNEQKLFICKIFAVLLCIVQSGYLVAIDNQKFDNQIFLCTHNSFCCKDYGFILTNQNNSIEKQLQSGVRALMLDVYNFRDDIYCYHTTPVTGKIELVKVLLEVKEFLKSNPEEIVTIIFESYIQSDELYKCFAEAEIDDYIYFNKADSEWPFVSEMIQTNKRLVVFSDSKENAINKTWCNYLWDFCVETNYDNKKIANLKNEFNRGNIDNDLIILNHFVYSAIGTGSRRNAARINSENFFRIRISQFIIEKKRIPNFIAVDFYDIGDCYKIVEILNSNKL